MRVFIMFDLPMETKQQIRTYQRFRKTLIAEGFLMMQFSIYIKSCLNKEAAQASVQTIKRMLPRDGHVRALIITEKQYEKMQILIGQEDENIQLLGDNRRIIF